jgi:hypothetical protein
MFRRRTRAGPRPVPGFVDPGCEQRLRRRGHAFDPTERRPDLRHIAQQNVVGIERTHQQSEGVLGDPRRRQRDAHPLLDHSRCHPSTMTEGCDNYGGADQMS